MPDLSDLSSYERRARDEREKAAVAPTAEIAALHRQLAEHYEEQVRLIRAQPVLPAIGKRAFGL